MERAKIAILLTKEIKVNSFLKKENIVPFLFLSASTCTPELAEANVVEMIANMQKAI